MMESLDELFFSSTQEYIHVDAIEGGRVSYILHYGTVYITAV